MDKDILKMDKALRTTDRLAQSINIMDQLKKITTTNMPTSTQVHKQYISSPQVSFARTSAAIP